MKECVFLGKDKEGNECVSKNTNFAGGCEQCYWLVEVL